MAETLFRGREFALLADLADVACFQVDAERRVVDLSPAMERLSGFSREEAVGRSCLDLMRCEECLRGCAVFRFGRVQDRPITLFRKNGSQVRVEKSGQLLRDSEGRILGAVETVRPLPAPGAEDGTIALSAGEQAEANRIRSALERCHYSRRRAAALLGISRTTLWRKMRQYHLE